MAGSIKKVITPFWGSVVRGKNLISTDWATDAERVKGKLPFITVNSSFEVVKPVISSGSAPVFLI